MPELPEVETTVRGLARYLEGQTIARIRLNRANLRRPFPPELVQVMTGARITATLLNNLATHDKTFGIETMCVGGGQGMAMVVERLS